MSVECQLNLSAECNASIVEFSAGDTSWLQTSEQMYQVARSMSSGLMVLTGVLGALGNIVTILVFKKMGYSETINISYTALAISDLICVATFLGCGGYFLHQDPSFQNYTAGSLAAIVSRITCLITAWISFERCMSVAFPIQVKFVITRKVNTVVLVAMFAIVMALPVATFLAGGFVTPQNNFANFSVNNAIDKSSEAEEVNKVVFIMFGAIIPLSTWLCIAICTSVLIINLRTSSMLRHRVNSSIRGTGQQRRKNRVTKKVITIAVIFLVSSAPFSGCILVKFLLRYEVISLDRALIYLTQTVLMISMWINQLNSSINIVVFTVLGQQFRKTLYQMFSCSCC